MLELRDLRKKYDNGPEALRGVNLSVKEGEVLSLIGPSGAGKSTLIRCINRLVEPTSGQIFLGGVDICGLGTKELRHTRKQMGMIFQEYALVERLSVMENVLSGRLGSVSFMQSLRRKYPTEYVEEALRLLDRVGLSDYVDTRADQLSGGQRQRVGICRALLQDPDLLLIDEPTASLDPKTAREIMRLITELVHERKVAAIINLHEITLAEMFTQRVIGLKDGKIVYDKPAGNLTTENLTLIYGEEDWAESPEPTSESESEEVS